MERIDNIIAKKLTVLVGDAKGMDKAVQKYLNKKQYKNVLVFCMENTCRNNEGAWPTREIQAVDSSRRNFEFYSTKDRAMAEAADYGLMLWDGESRGTLSNVIELVQGGKPVIVYLAPRKTFFTIRNSDDLSKISGFLEGSALSMMNQALQLRNGRAGNVPECGRQDSSLLF